MSNKKARLVSDVDSLVGKICQEINGIPAHEAEKNLLWRQMQAAKESSSVDDLVKVLRRVRRLSTRIISLAPITEAMADLVALCTRFVRQENDLGHKGQKLFDISLRDRVGEADDAVQGLFKVRDNEVLDEAKRVEALVKEVTFEVNNFVWDFGFCRCGEPLFEQKGRDGKPVVYPLCRVCFDLAKAAKPEKPPVVPPQPPVVLEQQPPVVLEQLPPVESQPRKKKGRKNKGGWSDGDSDHSDHSDGARHRRRREEQDMRRFGVR